MSDVMLFSGALDAAVGKRPRHYFFDAVEVGGGKWAVVMTGEDDCKVGGKRRPQLVFNDAAGEMVEFTLAHGPEDRCKLLAAKLIAFYASEGAPMGARLASIGGDVELLRLVIIVGQVDGTKPHAHKVNGWRVESRGRVADKRRDAAAARVRAIGEILEAGDDAALANLTEEQLAAMEAILAARGG